MTFFFFSSRRRHTRWNCDWSSDVCSSDLNCLLALSQTTDSNPNGELRVMSSANSRPSVVLPTPPNPARSLHGLYLSQSQRHRSEERRVGKSVNLGGRRTVKKRKT